MFGEDYDEEEEDGSEIAVEYFPNYRPIPNTNKRFTIIAEDNAKQALQDMNISREREAQRLSRLYCAGSDSPMIQTDVIRRERREIALNIDKYRSTFNITSADESPTERQESEPRIFHMTDSLIHSTKDDKSQHSETRYNQYSHGDWRSSLMTRNPTEHHAHLRTSTALSLLNNCTSNGLNATLSPSNVSPYSTRYLAEPQQSSFTKTTPIEWNINAQREVNGNYVKSLVDGQSHCSKSFTAIQQGSMSALQASLVACGHIVAPGAQDQHRIESKVQQSLLTDGARLSKHHAEWLLNRSPRGKQISSDSKSTSKKSSFLSSQFKSQSQQSLLSKSRNLDDLRRQRFCGHVKGSMLEHDLDGPSKSLIDNSQLAKVCESQSVRSKKTKSSRLLAEQLSTYEGSLASHLNTETKDTTTNPFRIKERDSKIHLSASKSLSTLRNRQVDPKTYSNDSVTTHYGEFAVSVKEPYVTGVPSVDKVNKALVQLSRRMIVCYDTKVVETGAALKALQDIRHPTPGIAAIVDLNRAFCDAASFNPSSWQLSRHQFEQIFAEKVPWHEKKAISRLASAYDPHRSGVIKFVRVTAALMVGNRPAMSILMAQLTRDPDNIDKTGNVFLLRLLHGLYEDCDGGVVEQAISSLEQTSKATQALNIQKKEGVGVKLEDIKELLSAACTSLEDEIEMQALAEEVVQALFHEGQKKDIAAMSSTSSQEKSRPFTRSTRREVLLFGDTKNNVDSSNEEDLTYDYTVPSSGTEKPIARVVLKHSTLKGVRTIPSVNQTDFVKCITRHPTLMTVFDRQLTRFRELMLPYVTKGTISFERSLQEKSVYGSRSYH